MSEDTHEHWARCLLNIERRVRPQSFDTWFRPTKVGRFDADLLEIEVTSSYFAEWVESNYLSLIKKAVQEETGLAPRVVFSVSGPDVTVAAASVSQTPDRATPPIKAPAASHSSEPLEQKTVHSDGSFSRELAAETWSNRLFFTPLNERYCFETFVVGEGNRFAHAAAQAVSRSPSKTQFNPLVIYGGVGLGKTHLLQAIGHYALIEDSSLRVAYVPSEKFMNDFIESLKVQNTEEFQRSYRSADLLLVDDIQFLLRGEQTQGEFFHTFNALHQNSKQIVMTCDSPPGELKGLEERLISRFQWGLVTSIEPPDLETRIAILHQKAEINGINLGEEVATFLGSYISSNVRELEGALNHIMAYCAVNQVELSVGAARTIVHERMSMHSEELNIEGIQKAVAAHFSLTQELLIGKTRKQEVSSPRQIAMFLAKRLTKNPLKVIGLHFGNRDHSTVIHAVQTVGKKCDSDDAFARVVESLSESIQQQHNI